MKKFNYTLREKRILNIQSYNLEMLRQVSRFLNGICEEVDENRLQPCKAKKQFIKYISIFNIYLNRYNKILYNNKDLFNIEDAKTARNEYIEIVRNSQNFLFN